MNRLQPLRAAEVDTERSQGLKPVLHLVNVRAEARILQRVGSHAGAEAQFSFHPLRPDQSRALIQNITPVTQDESPVPQIVGKAAVLLGPW
jgi:hypothetical protein